MKESPQDKDSLFEGLLQELPEGLEDQTREFKAFVRGRKVRNVEQLLGIVFLHCGMDKTTRETAGIFTLLEERIMNSSVLERLQACGPWLKVMLREMLSGGKEVAIRERRSLSLENR